MEKEQLEQTFLQIERENELLSARLRDAVCVTEYRAYTREQTRGGRRVRIWTEAFQRAVREHEIVRIPAADEPYYLDGTIIVPSMRRIEAEDGAVMLQTEDTRVLMLRNEHTRDGAHAPIRGEDADENIAVIGGRWEESRRARGGYGKSGMYDEPRGIYGVSACMFFNNVRHLTIKNVTFAHAAGFAVQMGDIQNVTVRDMRFCSCYADGLHINGNTYRAVVRGLSGQVGDDLLALNMYDWQGSSADFGPMDTLLAEDLTLSEDSGYKALRIQPGVYRYDDGSEVDCSFTNAVIRSVRGIQTFKMYLQTPPYRIADKNPEYGGVGSGDNIWFEDIDIDLNAPVDALAPYIASDAVRGRFAAFEIGANLNRLTLRNVRVTLHRETYPLSYLVTVGPKSVPNGEYEIFDPYVCCRVRTLTLHAIEENGAPSPDPRALVCAVRFTDLYGDGFSSGAGMIEEIVVR